MMFGRIQQNVVILLGEQSVSRVKSKKKRKRLVERTQRGKLVGKWIVAIKLIR